MEKKQIDQILIMTSSKLPVGSASMLTERLLNCEYSQAMIVFSQLKDPTISLVLSILVGQLGVDRFYLKDVGLGIGKLLTCGGLGIWWIIDLFLIMDATRQKNLETILTYLP